MKLYSIFLLLACTLSFLCTSVTAKEQFPPYIYVNACPIMNQNLNSSLSSQLMQNEAISQMKDFLSHMYHEQKCKYDATTTLVTEYIKNNKIKCLSAALASTYVYIAYQICMHDIITKNPLSWCNWQNNCDLEALLEIPSEKMGRELLHEIQARYADPLNPTNFVYSLVQFIKVIEIEIALLQEQKQIYDLLVSTGCARLFFINKLTLDTIQAKLHKILFIKHVFSTWYATYKIEKNS